MPSSSHSSHEEDNYLNVLYIINVHYPLSKSCNNQVQSTLRSVCFIILGILSHASTEIIMIIKRLHKSQIKHEWKISIFFTLVNEHNVTVN